MTPTTNENITVWDSPYSNVKTVDGIITYLKWCEMEMERWRKRGKNTRLLSIKNPSGVEHICIGRA